MDTNITKTWTIKISEDEVFARCTNETLYQAYSRAEENPKYDAVVIQDDDKGQFRIYYNVAMAHLHMLLARRLAEPQVDAWDGYSGTTTFNLQMHDNHDNNVLQMLGVHCVDFLVKKVLEQWYHADFGSELERLEINHCLHYRKHPVRRRLDPLI